MARTISGRRGSDRKAAGRISTGRSHPVREAEEHRVPIKLHGELQRRFCKICSLATLCADLRASVRPRAAFKILLRCPSPQTDAQIIQFVMRNWTAPSFANSTGHRASIPSGLSNGLPVGMQVIGRRNANEMC